MFVSAPMAHDFSAPFSFDLLGGDILCAALPKTTTIKKTTGKKTGRALVVGV